jgi:hypothetical protein
MQEHSEKQGHTPASALSVLGPLWQARKLREELLPMVTVNCSHSWESSDVFYIRNGKQEQLFSEVFYPRNHKGLQLGDISDGPGLFHRLSLFTLRKCVVSRLQPASP